MNDLDKKIEFLENKLKITDDLLKNIIEGNPEKIKKSLNIYNQFQQVPLLISLASNSKNEDPNVNYNLLKLVIDKFHFPVFIKDENCNYLLINEFEAELFKLPESEIIGRNDRDFVKDAKELEMINSSDEEVLTKNRSVELPNQKFSLSNGMQYVFKTHKMPFENPITMKRNIIGFSLDVTDTINLNNLRKFLFNKI
jgi:hypothetical protein